MSKSTRKGGGGGGPAKRNLAVFEGVSETFRIQHTTQLEAFRENLDPSALDEIVFGKSLTNHERRYIHALAGQLGLVSKSYGKGADRYLTVRKTAVKVNPMLNVIEKLKIFDEDLHNMNTFVKKHPQAAAVAVTARQNPGAGLYSAPPPRKGTSMTHRHKHEPLDPTKTPLFSFRSNLPSWILRDEIAQVVAKNPAVVLSGETGCGKSTQVPQFIMDSVPPGSPCKILVSQPRRIAAMGLAERVSAERGEPVGQTVGYSVRLESRTSPSTELLYCTAGVLLRQLASNPTLKGVTHVIVDEVHERDHFSDFLLISLRELLKERSDFRVILMSATLERGLFQKYFNNCPCVNIPGRAFPVDQYFLEDVFTQTEFMGPVAREDVESDTVSIECIALEKSENSEAEGVSMDALAFLDAWEDGDDEKLGADGPDHGHSTNKNDELEIAAAKLAVSKFHKTNHSKRHSSGRSSGRKIETLINEYVESIEEGSVDITLVLSLLEHVCLNSDSIDDTSIQRNGVKCRGGILVFLSGWSDISQLMEIMAVHSDFGNSSRFRVLPLHGGIAPAAQRSVFKSTPPLCQKIVLATNIAETSITIDDIVVVIDAAKVKEHVYDPYTQMASLTTNFVSKASSRQRQGRAGRVQRGKCFTLVSKSRFDALANFQVPELLRTPLDELCLQIKLLCGDKMSITTFLQKAPDPPQEIAVRDSIIGLKRIGALDRDENLTRLGHILGKLPMEPRLGRMVLLSIPFGCLEAVIAMCCSLGYRDPFLIPMDSKSRADCNRAKLKFASGTGSDHIANIFALAGFEEVMRQHGERGIFDYCRQNQLSHSTMRMIMGMKKQVLQELNSMKLVPQNGWQFANRNNGNPDVIKSVLAAGLYPNLLRRHPMQKNFQGRGNRKCRVQKNSVPNLESGPLSKETKSFAHICFGEMLKGERTELVRDATVLSPYSILFCTGSAYSVGADDDEDIVEGEDDDDGKTDKSTGTYDVLLIDDSVRFKIPKTSIEVVRILRGLLHAVMGCILDQTLLENRLMCEAVDTIVAILNRHRSCQLVDPGYGWKGQNSRGRGFRGDGGNRGGGRSRGGGGGGRGRDRGRSRRSRGRGRGR